VISYSDSYSYGTHLAGEGRADHERERLQFRTIYTRFDALVG
jgi:hypothetical protein